MPASARVHADCFCKGGCQAPPRMVHATRCGTSHRNRASGQKHKLLPLRRGRCLRRSCRVGHWHRALCYAAGQPFRKVLRRLCFACSLTVGHVVGGTVSLTCAGAAGARRAAASAPHVGSWPDPGRSSTQVLLPTAADGHTRVAGMPLKWHSCHSSGILVVTRVAGMPLAASLPCIAASPRPRSVVVAAPVAGEKRRLKRPGPGELPQKAPGRLYSRSWRQRGRTCRWAAADASRRPILRGDPPDRLRAIRKIACGAIRIACRPACRFPNRPPHKAPSRYWDGLALRGP